MAKTANSKNNPSMEGGVNRAIDFSLKKEDLMLLILEGRKENMEEQIAQIQGVSTQLNKDLYEAEKAYKKKVLALCGKTLNADAKKLARMFSDKEEVVVQDTNEDEDELVLDDGFKINLGTYTQQIHYDYFASRAIGDGKGSTYIKQTGQRSVSYTQFTSMKLTVSLTLQGKTFLKEDDLFLGKTVKACVEYSRDFEIANQQLDRMHLETLPEYKKVVEIAGKLGNNESLLSDVLAEYDLFNRNQPRAKAKMIKEVLGRDESGQALLDNIMTAASGVKLLAKPADQ